MSHFAEEINFVCVTAISIGMRRLSISLVSDFFHPSIGGVESHVFLLAQGLIKRGHKVIVITHAYPGYKGVHYLRNNLKVYYLPFPTFYNQCILPTLLTSFPILRDIFLREQIEFVHGHSAFSTLAHEAMFHAGGLGLKTVFTDHSLFGFADASAVVTNEFLRFSLKDVDHCICVSHTGKENTVLRADVPSDRVSVIPNAVDSERFFPQKHERSAKPVEIPVDNITVVALSRLVYRKGIDLLAKIIPATCAAYPNVAFIIGGDGPKRILLEEMREKHGLQERVALIGSVDHSMVPSMLNRGDIFINTSLTEAFCMAIVEAASCGLQVVSTKVGGVPEVLPEELIWLAEPNVEDLSKALSKAIDAKLSGNAIDPLEAHNQVKGMYQWDDVVQRTEVVYGRVMAEEGSPQTFSVRLKRMDEVEKKWEAPGGLLNVRAFTFLVLWYLFSLLTLFMNKYILAFREGDAAMLGSFQMVMTTVLGFVQMYVPLGMYKLSSASHRTKSKKFWGNMVLVGSCRFATIYLGLVALDYVAVSFTETVKSSAPIFTVMISWFALGEASSPEVIASTLPIMGGLALCSATELTFNFIGFLAALGANLTECFQNVYSKMLLSGENYNPAELQFYTSISSVALQIPLLALWGHLSTVDWSLFASYLLNGAFFHFQSITAYVLMGYISPVTHSVANTVKRALLIWLSILVFHNEVSFLSMLGTFIVIVGVFFYNQARSAPKNSVASHVV